MVSVTDSTDIFPGSPKSWAYSFAITTSGALFLALIGPFGSYLGTALGERIIFQLFCFWSGTLLFGVTVRLIRVKISNAVKRWTAIIFSAAAITLPFSWATRLVGIVIWPFIARISPVQWYWQGLITAEPVVIFLALSLSRHIPPSQPDLEPRIAPSEGLLGMPPSEVHCLQMEDHYVRVHGSDRSHLVLATLGQAMECVAAIDGLQVHRSWWVARHAVIGAELDGRNLRIRLRNGIIAPVARSSVASARAAGFTSAPLQDV
jgi:hypothetical protein